MADGADGGCVGGWNAVVVALAVRVFSWFENHTFHIGELCVLKAVIEHYHGLELNDDATCRLRMPHGLDARAELRALSAQNGGFKLAHELITQDLIVSGTLLFHRPTMLHSSF